MNKKTYAVTCIFMAVILVAICAVSLIRVKNMESQLETASTAAIERDELTAMLAESELKLAESESYVGAIRTERDAATNVLTSVQTERDLANESLDSVQAERDAANAIAEAAKTERDILYKRLDDAYARIAELEKQLGIEPTVTALPETISLTAEATAEPAPEATEIPEVEATEIPEATEVPEATEAPEAEPTAAPEATAKKGH